MSFLRSSPPYLEVLVVVVVVVVLPYGTGLESPYLTSTKTLKHELSHLLLPVFFPQFLYLLFSLQNPLFQENLLVHHLLALLQFRHVPELGKHPLDPPW
ncbi:hypothetical protein Lal_00046966 [Lupinus albus]|nr:hypothetical protein Lal_00046966 [Lupinus albus]